MLNNRTAKFADIVLQTAERIGNSAPKIADEILQTVFPGTMQEAGFEGAEKIVRLGAIDEIKRILRNHLPAGEQSDFDHIAPGLMPVVRKLKSKTYYVESAGEYVSIPRLIAEPALLDDARSFMRKKGTECIGEADRLDELYHDVVGT